MRKSEACRGVKGDAVKKGNSQKRCILHSCSLLCHLHNETCRKHPNSSNPFYFLCEYSSGIIRKLAPATYKSSGFAQDRTGELRMHSTVSEEIQTQQNSVFLLLIGGSRKGEAKERDS